MSSFRYKSKSTPISLKIKPNNLLNEYNKLSITSDKYIDDSKFINIKPTVYSESSNFPNFPPGTTPPDDNILRLIYLNYVASRTLEKKL
jgi:hypothetical protein